jgi:protein-disulfide isomerase
VELAVGAACAAVQDRYWQFHDMVFWNQGRENKGDHDAAFIASMATGAEVDMTSWQACIARSDMRTAVGTATQAALAAGINSTPTLVINGQVSVGVPSYTKLADLIRQLAAGASPGASPASGTPAATPVATPAAS